jgi:hypothetical protein
MNYTETKIVKYGDDTYKWSIKSPRISYLNRKGIADSLNVAWMAAKKKILRVHRQIFNDEWNWILIFRDMTAKDEEAKMRYYYCKIIIINQYIEDKYTKVAIGWLDEQKIAREWENISVFRGGAPHCDIKDELADIDINEIYNRYGGSCYSYEDKSNDEQKEIVTMLEDSNFVKLFKNKNGFYIDPDAFYSVKNGDRANIIKLLIKKEFKSIKHVLNYNVVYSEPDSKYGEKFSFFDLYQGQTKQEMITMVNEYIKKIAGYRKQYSEMAANHEKSMPDPHWSDSQPIDSTWLSKHGMTDNEYQHYVRYGVFINPDSSYLNLDLDEND